MSTPTKQFSVASSLNALPFLLDCVENELAILGVNKESCTPVLLATDEVFSNIVMYGQLNAAKDVIQLNLSQTGNQLCIDICDAGPPFDPTLLAASAMSSALEPEIDELSVGGWGLLLVKTLTTDIQYMRENGMNHFTMYFTLPHPSDDAKSSA